MNIPNYINVPSDTLNYEYILNRQSNNEYLLNNITRCAVIFNYIANKTERNLLVEHIFDEFCAFEDPSKIPSIFLKHFEAFIHIYMLERFGKMYNIFISEAEIKSICFPVHAFCSGTTIVVLYSKADLKSLVNNISLYQYMYFNEKYFLMPRRGCDDINDENSILQDKDNKKLNEINELQKTMEDIQKAGILNSEVKVNYTSSFNSYCNKLNNNQQSITNVLPEIKNMNSYKITNANPLTDSNKKHNSLISEGMPSDLFQIQANFAKIWAPQNHIHLTYLIMITHILEVSIRPILCTILTDTVERNIADKKIKTEQLYKDFLDSFTHSVSIDLKAYMNAKENKATDFKYTNLVEIK